jgi:hypothetical protein
MGSENPSGADNQQETIRSMLDFNPWWVVGFVDGEGCFSVSIHRNGFAKSTGGWQLHPVFHVYQHEEHGDVLEQLVITFGCGRIRGKGPNSRVSTYAVESLADLNERVIPFFEKHPLIVKRHDFTKFTEIVRGMLRKEHLQPEGFERFVRLAYAMNLAGKQRSRRIEEILMGSSETARQALHSTDAMVESVKVQSDPHGDMGSQAEMT